MSNEHCYDRENKNLLVRFSSDGTIEKYVYGNGLIASYGAKPTEKTATTDYRTYIYDIRGSVTEVADVTGSVIAEYRYSIYGDRSTISGSETDELGYCAREGVLTETSGVLYMRARYYYPALMRFINEDIVTGDISNSYLDVDGDGERDVVVVDPKYPIEFVIIEREHKYYGGALHGRQAQRMFTNGYILSSDGGGYECYYQIGVDKMGEFICEDLAIRTDDIPQRYLIHGDEVTEQEYETWIKENCKEGIKFEHYEEEASSINATE